jgi:hypothetical protein
VQTNNNQAPAKERIFLNTSTFPTLLKFCTGGKYSKITNCLFFHQHTPTTTFLSLNKQYDDCPPYAPFVVLLHRRVYCLCLSWSTYAQAFPKRTTLCFCVIVLFAAERDNDLADLKTRTMVLEMKSLAAEQMYEKLD